ncbi:MAG TPA: glycosyl transferase family 2, partial [Pseudomonas sp.]|nr:glycosyl transferase family 2 [Pseudomonas sp.]
MKPAPLVTVVIPAFNPRFFAMALHSAVSQTYENLEVVVCDDSEGEEIEQLVNACIAQGEAKIRYLRNPQPLGFVGNVLRCVDNARGEFIKVLCDDDRLLAHCVAAQAQVLSEYSEVNLVLAPRLFCDAQNYLLPLRMQNARIPLGDSLFKGQDILAFLDRQLVSFLGNFSAALMRTGEARELLQALTQEGQGFAALLDLVLFVCLLRRANMVMLGQPGAIERLHPGRLSKQINMLSAAENECDWLMQMLASRTGEDAPADGWIRYVKLADAEASPRDWQELSIQQMLSNWQTRLSSRVGTHCESYDELYRQWLSCRQLSVNQQRLLPQTIAAWPAQPRIVPVVLDPWNDPAAVRSTLDSLVGQLYAPSTVMVFSNAFDEENIRLELRPLRPDWPAQLNGLIEQVEGDWVYLLRAGDVLNESALLVLAERVAVIPGLSCVYSDEGGLQDGHSFEPVFKPDFNLDLMRSYPYVGRSLAFSCKAIVGQGGFEPSFGELAPHDLLWRLTESQGLSAIEHIAEIQLESTFSFAQWVSLPEVIEQSPRVLSAHLQRLGIEHRIRDDGQPWLNRVDYLHGQRPLVSIIIPVGDDLTALQQCVEGLIELTGYRHYELLIVGKPNASTEIYTWLDAMERLAASMLRVLRGPDTDRLAVIGNFAAGEARGEYLLLLSPSSQIYSGDWLDELLNHALRPEVGIVGAKVIDKAGKIIHAGMVLGVDSSAGATFEGEDAQGAGYMHRLQVVQNWSAVSGDCLMVRKAVFDSVGGLDETTFGDTLADLDLCLKVGAKGYLVVWTPYASLARGLVATGGSVVTDERQREAREAFCQNWLPRLINDPAYNPSLSLIKANFALDPGLTHGWNPLRSRSLPSVLGLPINASAVGHYRVIQPFLELEAAGEIVGRLTYDSPSVVDFQRMNPDVVIFQLRHSSSSVDDMLRLTKFSNARRIFEIDDYILEAPQKNTHARNTSLDIREQLQRGIAQCERVVVTTNALANTLSDMHRDIRVVPNMLAPHLWTGLRSLRGTSSKPRVGWGGGTSHTGDLEIIAELVQELAGEVEWVFFGMCPEQLRPYIHEFHPCVGLEVYPAKLASLNLDLALAPLEF